MPFIKISGLTTATAVSATNQFEINQNGGSRSATVAQVAAFARTSATDPVVLPAGTVSAPALTFTGDTNTGIYSPAADTIAFTEGGVEAMRIDSSGNVGIGSSSPADLLTVNRASGSGVTAGISLTTAAGSVGDGSYIKWTGNGTAEKIARIDGVLEDTDAGSIRFNTGNGSDGFAERARITHQGRILVNRTSQQSGSYDVQGAIYCEGLVSNYGIASHSGIDGAYQGNAFNFQWNGSAARLWVDTTDLGSISTSSDYRVKKNVETQTASALDRVQQIRPVIYTYADFEPFSWKADGVAREGFIAHELAEVIPSAVEGEKDEPHKVQSLKLDALCSVLVKAIQELKAGNDALKARVAALENK